MEVSFFEVQFSHRMEMLPGAAAQFTQNFSSDNIPLIYKNF